ncbi:MAG: PAS domain S-box protein [Planctomycetes bacterium]|nr:PAS domain S-box protein [Planctomycetota bacterium]
MRTPKDIAMEMLVERIDDYAIFTLDAIGRITSWNPAAQRMKGYTEQEAIGQNYSILYTDEGVRSGEPEWNLRIANDQGFYKGEGLRRRKNGETFNADISITKLPDPAGGFAKIVRDISQRVRERDELHKANRDLEQFASIAAHDLQEPLRMVTNFLGLLERRAGLVLDEQARGYLAHAVEGAERMSRLTNHLLTLARVSRESVQLEPTEISSAWEEAVDNMSETVKQTGAAVTRDELPMALATRQQIVQLFQNIISNSLKYRHQGVVPSVHAGSVPNADARMNTFYVKDNGIGMPRADLKRVFDAFTRLHSRGEVAGTGLGLTICSRIVERHRGRMWVESEVGNGSTFYFSLLKS